MNKELDLKDYLDVVAQCETEDKDCYYVIDKLQENVILLTLLKGTNLSTWGDKFSDSGEVLDSIADDIKNGFELTYVSEILYDYAKEYIDDEECAEDIIRVYEAM